MNPFSSLNDLIYKKILDFFYTNFEKNEENNDFEFFLSPNGKIENLKKFMSCLPSLNSIFKSIKKINFGNEKNFYEIFFIKIILEIILKYLKSLEDHLNKVKIFFKSSQT